MNDDLPSLPATADSEQAFERLLQQLAEAPDAERVPARLGRFRLVAKLGEGGMGTVYRAVDEKLGRTVALKCVSRRAAGDAAARARLLREARAASALAHPNIVTIFAIEEADGVDFIVMELVDGEPLDLVIARGALPASEAVRIAAELCDGLAAAHAVGLVHRDVKPGNVVLTSRGAPKLLDFGIVAAAGPIEAEGATQAPLTAAGAILGTVPYMSPEQLRGRAIDGRADVFSVGCVLYELLAGRRAFPGHDLLTLVEQITQGEPPPPSSVARDVPAALDAIVARALARDAGQRYTALELADALRGHAADARAGAPAPADAAPTPVGRARERGELAALIQRAAVGAGGLVLVVGEAGMGKTELVDALVRHERGRIVVGRGRCLEHFGAREAYAPLFELLDDLLAGPRAGLVRQILVDLAPTWALRLHVASLHTRGVLERDAFGATRDRMVRELGDALAEISTLSPLLIVLEDLQWAEPSTVDALQALVPSLERRRIGIIATARAREVEHADAPARALVAAWRARGRHVELHLGPLTEPDVAALLAARFAPNDFDPGLAAALHARAEGHPLFAVAMIERLEREGLVRQDARGWHAPAVDPAALRLPDTLHAMLRAKLDALPPDDRALLEHASIQGAEFVSTILADVAQLEEAAVDARLHGLAREGALVRPLSDEALPDGSLASRWRFGHASYRDALYGAVSPRRRAQLHAQVAASLARRHAGAVASIARALASHHESAHDYAAAHDYHRQAGDNAMALLAADDAAGHYAAARACVDRLPGRERDAIGVLRQGALAHQAAGRSAAALEALRDALARARRLDDVALVGAAHVALADALITAHELAAARPHLDAARALADRAGLDALRADAHALYALDRILVGELESCRAALDAIAAPGPLPLYVRGLLQFFCAEYAAAVRTLADELEAHEDARGDALLLMEGRMIRGLALANGGQLGEALRLLEATLQQARRNANLAMTARLENSIGWIYRELGLHDLALAHDERAIEAGRESGETEAEANALVNVSEDRIARGDPAHATQVFGRVREIGGADEWARWRYGLRMQAVLARAALAAGDHGSAALEIDALRARAEAYLAGKYVVIAHELAARLALATGDLAAADEAIAAGRAQLARTPTPLVAWKLEALAARIAEAAGQPGAARHAREVALAGVNRIARGLTMEQRVAFLGLPTVRALRPA